MPLNTCPVCKGTKEQLLLGLMRGKCPHCDGKGYIASYSKPESPKPTKIKRKPKYPLLKDDSSAKEADKSA